MTTNDATIVHARTNGGGLRVARTLFFPISVIALWATAAHFLWLPRVLLPHPADVIARLWELSQSGVLARHALASISRLASGILLGGIPGIAIGVAVGMFRICEDFLSPTLRFLTPVPVLAWMPLVIVFFGIDEAAKVSLLAIGVFFIVYAATAASVRAIDNRFIEVCRLYRKGMVSTIYRVILPAAAPTIFEGLRGALALSWVVLVAAEIMTAREGLGWLLWDARIFGRTVDAYGAMIVVGVLGLASDAILVRMRDWIVDWRADFRGL